VFFNRNLTVSTKVAVYKAICLSILLYGCESWIPYRRHIKALEAYHVRCLQSILDIRWWHRKTHTEICDTAKNWFRWAPITTKTTSVTGSRHRYAIQPSSTSSTLWRTATRIKTSWPTKAALLWPHQVRTQEMQHPRISARGTRRRQGSVEFDMCHRPGESCSSSWTSS